MEARPGSSAPSSTRLFTMQYIFSLFFSVRRFENVLFCRNLLYTAISPKTIAEVIMISPLRTLNSPLSPLLADPINGVG